MRKARQGGMNMLSGIDISNHQAPMDFGDVDFVIMKASEGKSYKDARLNQHYNNIGNKLYGFYHYARPDTGNTPEEEADWFLSLVGHHAGKCIFALDWEDKSLNYRSDWALSWLRRVYAKTGVKPLIYLQSSAVMTGKYANIASEDYGLWIAHWDARQPKYKDFSVWAIWQYTVNVVDRDYFNGDIDAWLKYCRKQSLVNPPDVSDNELKIGDTIRVRTRMDYNNVKNDAWVLDSNFKVMGINGDRIVIGNGIGITGAWRRDSIRKV